MAYKDTYTVWKDMRRRCNNPNRPEFKDYGGRGIAVCAEWFSYEQFHKDMGERPTKQHSIDRIDNNGDYEPINCRWANRKEQANNRRSNRTITIDGVTKNLTQWIEHYNLKPSTVRQRYYSYGWNIKKALEIIGY